jgi:crotonobetainyl-CoA:carnitine CoA-transferase CaiB-like acyl-CoA transferase
LTRAYATRDGRFIQLMFLDPERYWEPLCRRIGCADLLHDPQFTNAGQRVEHGALLAQKIAAAIAQRDWEEWRPVFEAWDAPWELVKTIHEVAADPQVAANGYLFDVEVADGTPVKLAAGPVGFDGRSAPAVPRRAPLLGEHTEEILEGLGIGSAELERLRSDAAIQ